ncbi:hypothetical protein, partial [Mesorhizobium sp. M4B.F.Ca.ET.049.02.1.2]|uniref:hypothetical protein n=1 Tax=Mesorhizobium sp. M4B.F.Ca.ET.049.02.1.2 TaxID=2496752 RepID=UPI001AECE38B
MNGSRPSLHQPRSDTWSLQLRNGHDKPEFLLALIHVGMLFLGPRQDRGTRLCYTALMAIGSILRPRWLPEKSFPSYAY